MRPLTLVDLVDEENKPTKGLVSVRPPGPTESPSERAILIEAAKFAPVDFVFFRRFADEKGEHFRSSEAAAYVIDNFKLRWTNDQLAACHRELWLHGGAPLVYVAWPTRVDILSCARRPDFWQTSTTGGVIRYSPAERIEAPSADSSADGAAIADAAQVSKALRQRFSAFRLASGTFWEDPENRKLANADAAAHRSLIQAIVEADRDLNGAEKPVLRRLLVLMVLIKYLEDREVFPPGLFGRFRAGTRSFIELLRDGTVEEVERLLRHLERKFNGDVFSLGESAPDLTQGDLKRFATLVGARHLGGQQHFWELFSFKNIPVEVISRVYQRFVTEEGAVYTPPLLASLLLDQAMPYERITGEESVLDPACGSGVFLVGAFKRLVTAWRSRRKWRRPGVNILKKILARSIHGVELERQAVDLTAFSLAVAICDALPPPLIWSSLTFDPLRGRNVREGDYFDKKTLNCDAGHKWPDSFDVIIGNPPFKSKLTAAAADVDATRPGDQPRLPDKQAAYLFLEWGLKSLAPGGSLCLIQPHGLLYNSQTADFRRYLMGIRRLHAILDFVSLRGLYEGADPKTIAWHAVHQTGPTTPVVHLTFRRTYSAAQRIAFDIDHYDWHVVSYSDAASDPFLWRVNLLGGGRLRELSERLRKMPTLAAFVADQGPAWDYGEGYIAGKSGTRIPAPFLTGKPLLLTRTFTDTGIDRERFRRDAAVVNETLFKSPYAEERYTPPLILFKAHSSLPVEFWDDGFVAYKDKIIGIHAPPGDRRTLRGLFEIIRDHKDIYQLCCALHGTQALTGKATVPLKQDLDLLPIPKNGSELALSYWEEALAQDVLEHMHDYVRLGQNSRLLKECVAVKHLSQYSSLFVKLLGSLYEELTGGEPVFADGLVAQPFYFGGHAELPWLRSADCAKSLRQLVYDHSTASLRTARVIRYYERNVILLVKPDRLRYWIRSTAIRDADDTLEDLRQQGW